MSKPTPSKASPRTGMTPPQAPAAPSTQRAGEVLRDTLEHLEEACARAGTGDIADRLRTVCDRLRSAQAALGPEGARAPDAGGGLSEQGLSEQGLAEQGPKANETEPY